MKSRALKTSILILIAILGTLGFSSITKAEWHNEAIKELKAPIKPPVVLPKHVRWGCLVCHSDTKLAKIVDNKEKSIFIDEAVIGGSVHKNIACVDCHTNFSYSGHPPEVPSDFKKVAGLACQKCHPYQFDLYAESTHGKLALSKKTKKNPAICSDCHGSHNIQKISDKEANKLFRADYKDMCAKCHKERAASYNDHYHGAPYKRNVADAPACWDCHNNHKILGQKDPDSSVNIKNLPETCNNCHTEANDLFTSYAKLIHGRNELLRKNFIVAIVYRFFPPAETKEEFKKISETLSEKAEKKRAGESIFARILRVFYPESLRPLKQDY